MKFRSLAPLSLALALFSCAAPKKAVVVQAAPTSSSATETASKPPEPNLPNGTNDGIRLPDMLTMPGDGDFRPTVPPASKTGTGSGSGSGAVIARPPTEPPSRPKTQDKDNEKSGQ